MSSIIGIEKGAPAFSEADVTAMRDAQTLVAHALKPMLDRGVPAVVVLFAMVRVQRALIRRPEHDRTTQQAILDALVPYLEGKLEPRGGTAESGIFLPPGAMLEN